MDVAVLYHFTARQLLPKVQAQGISKCGVPWNVDDQGHVRMMHGLQWLTVNPDFDEQSWAYPALFDPHRMRKTDARIAVGIPKLAEFKLVKWVDFASKHSLKVQEYFETFPDHKYWRIFIGRAIPPSWFVDLVKNPVRYQPELVMDPSAP